MSVGDQRRIFSVSDLTRNVRFLLEQNFSNIWVEGEITSSKAHSSGHFYFSLKDESSQLQCVMFRRDNQRLDFELGDGLGVLCFGRISVYSPRGQYQLYVERIEPKGLGLLQLRFEQLKEKLRLEGLFEPERKKPVPFLPARVGVITSLDGAALRDILQVLDRRYSNAHIRIGPCAVQGQSAAPEIVRWLDEFNRHRAAEVLILARGGGSLEDLWPFNEEEVARAIARSEIPVITGIGHETDFTISDFVADLRAPTPSAAAEIVLPRRQDLVAAITDHRGALDRCLRDALDRYAETLEDLKSRRVLRDPLVFFAPHVQRLDEMTKALLAHAVGAIRLRKEKCLGLAGRLEALGPMAVLKRGFGVSVKLPGEKVLSRVAQVRPGDRVRTRLSDGFFTGTVEEVRHYSKGEST